MNATELTTGRGRLGVAATRAAQYTWLSVFVEAPSTHGGGGIGSFEQVMGRPGCCRPDNKRQRKQYRVAADRQACESLCALGAACVAYEYTRQRRICELYPVAVHRATKNAYCECWSRTQQSASNRPPTTAAPVTTTTATTAAGAPNAAATGAAAFATPTPAALAAVPAPTPAPGLGRAFAQVQGQPGCCRPDKRGQSKQYKHAADRATCEDVCGGDGACLAYEFTLGRQLCEIYPARVHAIKANERCQCWSRLPTND